MSNTAQIHSIETFGTLDGPGIRMVIFMAGCFLRCEYCHNIDMTDYKNSQKFTVQELLKEILKNKEYYQASNGGVTFSGGEPLFQPEFLKEILQECRKHKIHTTIDTSLYTPTSETLKEIKPDLFMVSLKHFNDTIHKELTGISNKTILKNLKTYFSGSSSPALWLRLVILPGITDTRENLTELIKFTNQINYDKLELLPYNDMGQKKWEELGKAYRFKNLKAPSPAQLQKIQKFLKENKVKNVTF